MRNPTTHEIMTMGLDAFMDDTTHLIGNDTNHLLSLIIPDAQANVDLWQGLILASGGTLNPSKCSWTPFLWSFNNHYRNPTLLTSPDRPSYHITAPDCTGDRHTIHRNTPHEAVQLLWVHIMADGNYNTKLNILRQCQKQYCQFLHRTPLTRREARVIYHQCYLPKVTYPFPAMLMPPDKIYSTQLAITSLFLNKMGFHRHMPRAVIYAPVTVGGLNLCHLGRKQGVQQVLQFIKHLQANTTNGQLYKNLIDAYQVHAGILQHILQETTPLPWSPP